MIAPRRKTRNFFLRSREKVAMVTGPKGTEFDLSGRCSVCGHYGEIFDLPGRFEKYCLECSADVAAVILLTTEIDAATLAGGSTQQLVAEFESINSRMLGRAQSTELGNF
jgi:hypothetical protein